MNNRASTGLRTLWVSDLTQQLRFASAFVGSDVIKLIVQVKSQAVHYEERMMIKRNAFKLTVVIAVGVERGVGIRIDSL